MLISNNNILLSGVIPVYNEDYYIEAVKTIKKTKRELLLASETENLQEIFRKQNVQFMYLEKNNI